MKYSNHDWFIDLIVFVAFVVALVFTYLYFMPQITNWFANLLTI